MSTAPDHEAVGRAVERLGGATESVRIAFHPFAGTWSAYMGVQNVRTASGHRTPGEALIALDAAINPSWEARLQERCGELGLRCEAVGPFVRGHYWAAAVRDGGGGMVSVVSVDGPDRETACHAALVALDALGVPGS